jgi:molybdopterin converting factor subunit 1
VINITAQYFAVFREQAGRDLEELTTCATTAEELYAEVSARHGFADSLTHCKVAINDELAAWTASLEEGDVILFFPPVAGG